MLININKFKEDKAKNYNISRIATTIELYLKIIIFKVSNIIYSKSSSKVIVMIIY